MKTLKIIFTTIVLLITNIAQAQSKEETEQWLNEYGKQITLSYVTRDDDEKSFTNFTGYDGEFLNFFNIDKYSDGGSYQNNYKVSPKDILYQDVTKFSEDNFEDNERTKSKMYFLKSKSGTVFHSGKSTNGKNKNGATNDYLYHNRKSEIQQNTTSVGFFFSKEQSKEAVRLLKAIYHLAKLNGASDLPKVKKDIF